MNLGQTRGMVAISITFLVAVIVGLVLSFLAVERLTATQVLMVALITFIAMTPLFGYGVYTYARATEAEAFDTNEEMQKPRLLLDILRERGHGEVKSIADELNTTPSAIRQYIDDLRELALFSGIADWENGVIAMVEPSVIQAINRCRTCQTPIEIEGTRTICPTCQTEYYNLDS